MGNRTVLHFRNLLFDLTTSLSVINNPLSFFLIRPNRASTFMICSNEERFSISAWDQSDKSVKIYVQNLDGVGDLPTENVQCNFEDR